MNAVERARKGGNISAAMNDMRERGRSGQRTVRERLFRDIQARFPNEPEAEQWRRAENLYKAHMVDVRAGRRPSNVIQLEEAKKKRSKA